MALDNTQRSRLRTAMVGAFVRDSFELFLDDRLGVRLDTIVPPDKTFDFECQLVIVWADREGQLSALLMALREGQNNPPLKALAQELLGPQPAPPAPPGGLPAAHPHLVGRRPLVNRNSLWTHLDEVVRGVRNDRVLLINGGVGKTYSQWLIGHAYAPLRNDGRLAYVDANATGAAHVDARQLAELIANRLWGQGTLGDDADLAQPQRVAHDLAALMINRLAALPAPVWLIVDELDLVNLDLSALELLRRLCEALQRGECDQLWLFLVGLDRQKLGPRVSPYVAIDLVERPRRADIESHIQALAERAGMPLSAGQLKPAVDDLDALLPPAPDHAAWEAFHDLLVRKSGDIANGALP
jgi:type II secretory pathway predicted ATPase ExeA